jgi:FdhD protein
LIQSGIKIKRINLDGTTELKDDMVAMDEPVCIFVNDEPYRTLIASPQMLEELALGHLLTEGIISTLDEVISLGIKPLRVDVTLSREIDQTEIIRENTRLLTTACGMSSAIHESELKEIQVKPIESIDSELVFHLIKTLNMKSNTLKATGGTHSALLHYQRGMIFAEDVGRHNALDKVIGKGLREGVSFSECILVSSGRLSGEMVLKAARAGIPLLCSVSAPLLSGLRVAEETGVSLVGFVRGRRMNQYIHTA